MNPQLKDILMQNGIVVQQDIEALNIVVGIDSSNRYNLFGETGQKLGTVKEISGGAGGFLMRQIFQSARPCKLNILDTQDQLIGEMQKPFRFFFSEMTANYNDAEVGRVKRVGFVRRNYMISVGGQNQFTIQSSLFQWKRFNFDIVRNGIVVASIIKKYEGLIKMAFTQADNFSIQFVDKNLTLEERYTLFAALFLIDFDVFEQN